MPDQFIKMPYYVIVAVHDPKKSSHPSFAGKNRDKMGIDEMEYGDRFSSSEMRTKYIERVLNVWERGNQPAIKTLDRHDDNLVRVVDW